MLYSSIDFKFHDNLVSLDPVILLILTLFSHVIKLNLGPVLFGQFTLTTFECLSYS